MSYSVPMAEIIRRNTGHFFDADTKRFFRSRLPRFGVATPDGSTYFITSEQGNDSEGVLRARMYTVRNQDAEGAVRTVGKFQAYATRSQANRAMREAVKEAERAAQGGVS